MRQGKYVAVALWAILVWPVTAYAAKECGGQRYASGPRQVNMVELYTSEGCSSCPPADRWFSSLADHPGLYTDFVPLAFHVDYWNYLGWTDRLSDKVWSARQRRYAKEWESGTVYTPQFVINGREARLHRSLALPPRPDDRPGRLSAVRDEDGRYRITFNPEEKAGSGYTAHLAVTGSGLATYVRTGENGGRTLHHDFAALGTAHAPMERTGDSWTARLPVPSADHAAASYAVAVWVSNENDQSPLQVAGGCYPGFK